VAAIAALLVQFRNIIGPLILAFVIAYLLQPIVLRFSHAFKLGWRMSVNLIYLLLVVLLGGLVTLTGFAVVQQIQNLVNFVQRFINDLPSLAADLSTRMYQIGPFQFDFGQLNLQTLSEQLLATIQPLLGSLTSLISSFAASAAVTLGWTLFVLVISYFLLADAGQVEFIRVNVPGYSTDIRRLSMELKKIWNAFLRGQLIVITLVILSYSVLMAILGMRFSIGIAILAGLARFVPYLGPLIVWIVTAVVAIFQGSNYFGLQPWQYAILVLALAIILDQIFDNLVSPRFLGQALGIHPAAVLVAALVATKLIGVIGLVLAAPVLATLILLTRYVVRKMLELDPWPEEEQDQAPGIIVLPWTGGVTRLRDWLHTLQRRQ
jgi:predicted PurR-regulated permease PerM